MVWHTMEAVAGLWSEMVVKCFYRRMMVLTGATSTLHHYSAPPFVGVLHTVWTQAVTEDGLLVVMVVSMHTQIMELTGPLEPEFPPPTYGLLHLMVLINGSWAIMEAHGLRIQVTEKRGPQLFRLHYQTVGLLAPTAENGLQVVVPIQGHIPLLSQMTEKPGTDLARPHLVFGASVLCGMSRMKYGLLEV